MASHSDRANSKPGKHGTAVLGRSAATGRFVMAPASKRGSISVDKAKAAARSVAGNKKK